MPRSIRELQPGEFVRIVEGQVETLAPLPRKTITRCVFELVYFSRPDSTIFGRSVDAVRREIGRQLAVEHPVPGAEVVFAVPDSSNAMALGFSEVSGTKLEYGLIRNHYVGRTFINPTQALRVAKVKIKFNPVREVIEGRSVVMVDDSLVRGTTSKGLVQMVRAAGAKEVHLRLGSPPITGPCHYGIDTPDPGGAHRGHPLGGGDPRVPRRGLARLPVARWHAGCSRARHRILSCLLFRAVPDAHHGGTGAASPRRSTRRHARMTGSFTPPLVYYFGQGRADGTAAMKEVLGGKGAGLAEMTTLGIPVPPGFTITTTICLQYLEAKQFSPRLKAQVEQALQRLENATGRSFGDRVNPLLVSVRSGAPVSMPGMMETILNLGLNDETVEGLAEQSGNPTFAWDSYRRFVQMYASVVFDLPKKTFEHVLDERRRAAGVTRDIDLPLPVLKEIVRALKARVKEETGSAFPESPIEQLWGAVAAVFESWNTQRAIDYRRLHDIPDTMGTAVNVVAMVFGNIGEDSGTGVAFTRDPSTGEHRLYGEYLINAQGEDVVSGMRTPEPIETLAQRMPARIASSSAPRACWSGTSATCRTWSSPSSAAQLYMLQTRRGQRSGHAAVRIACEMVDEGVISREEAVSRIPPNDLNQLLHPTIDPAQRARPAHHWPSGIARRRLRHRSSSTPTAPSSSAAPGNR